MAEARERREWERAAMIAALIAEPHRDPNKRSRPYTFNTFNPYEKDRPQREAALPYNPGVLQKLQEGNRVDLS